MKIHRNIYLIVFQIGILLASCSEPQKSGNNSAINNPEIDSQQVKQFPYILELKNKGNHLIMYGCNHSFDTSNSMLTDIEKRLLKLNPDIVLNEGGDWQIFDTKNETILKSGEQGLTRYICNENNIAVKTFEPKPKQEFDFILSKYDKNDVLLMYFCRQISQLQRSQQIDDFQNYMIKYLSYLKGNGFPIIDTEKEYDLLITRYEKFFKEKFDWTKFNPENVWPNYNNTILNEINKEISKFRDRSILELIEIELNNNSKVFVIMGGHHLLKQEKAIKEIFKMNKSN